MALSEKGPMCKGDSPMYVLMSLCEYTHLKTFGPHVPLRVQSFTL